jgi:hypothetical protein
MNKIWKVSKYQLRDLRLAMLIYYTIIALITLTMVISYIKVSQQPNANMSFGGFGFSSVIFLFISGLNCFKLNFKFMQANNISRKRFFIANTITLTLAAAFMAIIDVILNEVIILLIPYEGMFEQLYRLNNMFADFMWSFALLAFMASLGWLITMLYYKCNSIMKIAVSLSPIFVSILITMLNKITNGAITKAILNFFTAALGFSNNNPYAAVVSFTVGFAGAIGICYLLIRRMSIKD